jgi:hypothetical protein
MLRCFQKGVNHYLPNNLNFCQIPSFGGPIRLNRHLERGVYIVTFIRCLIRATEEAPSFSLQILARHSAQSLEAGQRRLHPRKCR